LASEWIDELMDGVKPFLRDCLEQYRYEESVSVKNTFHTFGPKKLGGRVEIHQD
jgi:hypothetical protein